MNQEIKPTYVTFEQSQWLKDKGFDVKCKNYYLERDKELHEGFDHEYWGDYRCVNWNADVIGIKPFDGFSSAPEQWQVVEWLRVNHGIHIEICLTEEIPYKEFYFRVMKIGQYFTLSHSGIYTDTPQEAYSAAFDYIKNNNLI